MENMCWKPSVSSSTLIGAPNAHAVAIIGGGGYFSIVPQDNLFALRHAIHLPAELRRPGRGEYGQIQAKGISDDLGRIFQMGDRLIERMVPRAVVPAYVLFQI